MKIAIQNAILSDLQKINNLVRLSKGYWGYDTTFMDKFMEIFGMTAEHFPHNHTFLLMIEAHLAGLYSFFITKEDTLELEYFFLHPDYIGKGLGRQLWEFCCKTARALKKKEFILWSDPNAEEFYTKMGCQKIAEKESPIMPNRAIPILKYVL
jgi:streptomycin 6-kinase